jgi:pimeloyl-ACP methyl ester carboxylesterase
VPIEEYSFLNSYCHFFPNSLLMQLEIISRLPSTKSTKPPILCIHGAYNHAWCWDKYFLPYFAQAGYSAYALSLRGHGNSAGADRLYWASLADYVHDVAQVSQNLAQPPILIGHSMGGMIIQKYWEAHHSHSAAILMAAVPPYGLWSPSVYLAFQDPGLLWQLNLIQFFGLRFVTPSLLKKALFSEPTSAEIIQNYLAQLQPESQRVILDMLWLDLPTLYSQPTSPLLVLGAANDKVFPQFLVNWTAKIYDTQAHIFPNMAHTMMLEPAWQQVADYILSWLQERKL